ncbi:MAG: hypothetical protein K8U57_00740 [Planctomycetes bacterium]|nr:hypothetical protein [Planctomycetota bacterium]
MFAKFRRSRALLAALVLTCLATPASATTRATSHSQTTEAIKHEVAVEAPPTGSPELGILLIIGIVGVVILMAWLFSRVNDDSSTGSDVPA